MIRLSKKQKEEILNEAELRLVTKINIDWPLRIEWLTNTEKFCSKCDAPFTVPVGGYASGCPIHGVATNWSSWNKTYLYFEKKSEESFWIYKVLSNFDKKNLKYDYSVAGVLVYEKEDAFYLVKSGKTVARRPVESILTHTNSQLSSNLEELFTHDKFVNETGIIDFYASKGGKEKGRDANKDALTQRLNSNDSKVIEIILRTISFHKKEFYGIPVLEKAGYSSLLEYLKEKKFYTTLRNVILNKKDFVNFNKDAETLDQLLIGEIEILEKIPGIDNFTEGNLLKLKAIFNKTEDADRDAFLEMLNSPILKNNGWVGTINYDALYELMELGYTMKEIWMYMKRADLYEGIAASNAFETLRTYVKLKTVEGKSFDRFPENIVSEEQRARRNYSERKGLYDEKLFQLNKKLHSDHSYNKGEILIQEINSYEEMFSIKNEIGSMDTIKAGLGDTIQKYYSLQKVVAGDIIPHAIIRVDVYGNIMRVMHAHGWNNTGTPKIVWITDAIKEWRKEHNLVIAYK